MVKYLIISMRIPHWIKNLFIFAPIIFAKHLFELPFTIKATAAFFLFCLLSSAGYLINDILDLAEDKAHPAKRLRPIPSGKLSIPVALTAALIFGLAALIGGFYINAILGIILAGYALLQLLYSLRLKDIVILDVFAIALGFILRVLAGGAAVQVEVSHWLLICTGLLSLFLGFSKRRHELILLGDKAPFHRSILIEYSPYFLDQMISVVTSATLVAYILYTMSPETVHKFGTNRLILTTPFVLYGIFRYLYLVHRKEKGGSPARLLLTDTPLMIDVFLWILTAVIIIY